MARMTDSLTPQIVVETFRNLSSRDVIWKNEIWRNENMKLGKMKNENENENGGNEIVKCRDWDMWTLGH